MGSISLMDFYFLSHGFISVTLLYVDVICKIYIYIFVLLKKILSWVCLHKNILQSDKKNSSLGQNVDQDLHIPVHENVTSDTRIILYMMSDFVFSVSCFSVKETSSWKSSDSLSSECQFYSTLSRLNPIKLWLSCFPSYLIWWVL